MEEFKFEDGLKLYDCTTVIAEGVLPEDIKQNISRVVVHLPKERTKINSKTMQAFDVKKSLAFYLKAGKVFYIDLDNNFQHLEEGSEVCVDNVVFKKVLLFDGKKKDFVYIKK